MTDILSKFHPTTLKYLPQMDEYLVEVIAPKELFTARRFDLLSKYIYVKYRSLQIDSTWHIQQYDEHIKAFNNYIEGDGSEKVGIDKFLGAFDALIDSIEKNGFISDLSLVPVGHHNNVLDGAHRTAASLYNNKIMSMVRFDTPGRSYDYEFFFSRGLDISWTDRMALEFCNLKENSYVIMIFPSAIGKEAELLKIIESFSCVIYRKNIALKNLAPKNLIKQVYATEDWLGTWENDFAGAARKASACFQGREPLKIFLVEAENLEDIRKCKTQIRSLYGVGNHSVHINDNHADAIKLSQILFNQNSIHFLNHAQPKHFKNFESNYAIYKKWLEENNLNTELFCIDGSSVMALYGIRDARDVDFLHFDNRLPPISDEAVGSHNSEIQHYSLSRDDLLFDPRFHFYYEGLKFVNLSEIYKLKRRRNEIKDGIDVRLIQPYITDSNFYIKNKLTQQLWFYRFKMLYLRKNIRKKIPKPILKWYRKLKRLD